MALRLNSLVHVVLGEMTYFLKNNYEAKQGHKYKVYLLFLTAPWSSIIFFPEFLWRNVLPLICLLLIFFVNVSYVLVVV